MLCYVSDKANICYSTTSHALEKDLKYSYKVIQRTDNKIETKIQEYILYGACFDLKVQDFFLLSAMVLRAQNEEHRYEEPHNSLVCLRLLE